MSYATQQDLVDRIGEAMLIELTDRAVPPAGAIDGDVVASALTDTDAEIDGYLGGRYALPLAEPPALLTSIAGDIAVWRLHRWDVPEHIGERHKAAVRQLEAIAAGRMVLPVASGDEAPSAPAEAVVVAPPRRLNRDTLRGY